MVSHVKKLGAGARQNPKATRTTSKSNPKANPEPRPGLGPALPQSMAVDHGFGNAEGESSVYTEIWTSQPMQIESGNSSNDNGQVPHSNPNPPSTLAVAPGMGGEPRNEGDAPASGQENTAPNGCQGQPWAGAPSPSFLSGITPWTPMDSSIFTSLQPFKIPPEIMSAEALLASAATTDPSHGMSVPLTVDMNSTAAVDASRRMGMNVLTDGVAAPSTYTKSATSTVPPAPKASAPMDGSIRMDRQAP
ncbi:hypothetical protein CCMA1212_004840 [Trichoderma ghanense]|uniref:Uncharacterized protein n=1 Tax=Trichoderma ghanense TaxID=65468 RepID=A0ABY2H4K6_9HYPO